LEKVFDEKCIYWMKVHDLGNKVIYSIAFLVNNVLVEQGVTVYVKDRNTDNETIYFVGAVPPFLVSSPEPHPLEKLKNDVISKCGVSLVESYTVNPTGNFALVTGYIETDIAVFRKQFIAYLKNGEIVVKEVGG